MFKEKESIEILKIRGLFTNIEYQKIIQSIMKYIIKPEENINQEFRLKKGR